MLDSVAWTRSGSKSAVKIPNPKCTVTRWPPAAEGTRWGEEVWPTRFAVPSRLIPLSLSPISRWPTADNARPQSWCWVSVPSPHWVVLTECLWRTRTLRGCTCHKAVLPLIMQHHMTRFAGGCSFRISHFTLFSLYFSKSFQRQISLSKIILSA